MAFLQIEFMSRALGRSVEVKALLPSDHMAGNFQPPYRTLYFLPGYSASAMQLITYLGLRGQCELKGVAIVLPDGENLFYQDMPGRRTLYSTYVGQELVRETRRLLPLSDRREDTFLGGISMGGYGALYNGIRFRETFSRVAAFSPAADPYALLDGASPEFSGEQLDGIFGGREKYRGGGTDPVSLWCGAPEEERPALFLCCGSDDAAVRPAVERFESALREKTVAHTFRGGRGGHEFAYWEKQLDPAFSFLTGIEAGTRDRLTAPR